MKLAIKGNEPHKVLLINTDYKRVTKKLIEKINTYVEKHDLPFKSNNPFTDKLSTLDISSFSKGYEQGVEMYHFNYTGFVMTGQGSKYDVTQISINK